MPTNDHLSGASALVRRAAALGGALFVCAGLSAAPTASAAQTPWTTAIDLPATLQAENYDRGGEGTAYHDTTTANTGGAYRTSEGVDVQTTTDTGGGYAIGSGKAGEWVEYAVNVPTTGKYDIGLRVAAGAAGGKAHVELGGTNVSGAIAIAPTGGWATWTTVWVNGLTLSAAQNTVLRLALDTTNASGSSVANVNSITVRASGSTPSPVPTPTPKPGVTPTPAATPTPTPTPSPTPGVDYPGGTPTPPPFTSPPVMNAGSLWPSSWGTGASAPKPRFESTGITVGNKIYSFGGFYDYEQYVRRDYVVYDVPTNKWTTLGNLPTGMAETHLGVATDGRYIYFAGGLGGNVQHGKNPAQWISNRVYRYDTQTNAWTQIATLPASRGAGGLALIGRTLHYMGGVIADINTDKTDHWAYNLDTRQWTTKAPMPEAKDHFSTTVYGGQIYALLGEFGHHIEQRQLVTGHRYNPATNTWVKLANGPQGKSHAEASTFVSNGKIVIAGGQIENSDSTDRVAAYDPVANTWQNLKVLPAKRQGVIVQKIGARFVITTGGVSTRRPLANTWLGS